MNWNPFTRFSNKKEKQENDKHGAVDNNLNYQTFKDINHDILKAIDQKSVIAKNAAKFADTYANPTWQTFFSNDMLAVPVASNKAERINQYRSIAAYALCDWCLDEIADDVIHKDENDNFITFTPPDRLNSTQQDILQSQFKNYINLFSFDNDGYTLVKRFLIEGELAWENVINPKYPELGIVGIKFLPSEYYEMLIDSKTARPVGIVFDTEKFASDIQESWRASFASSAGIFNSISPVTYAFTFKKESCVPLLFNQLTYICSGEHSYDNLIQYPLIEKAKQAYHRLALMEDAAIIRRVTRAPERLLFNIDTGKLPKDRAEDYVRRFAQSLYEKKTPSPNGQDAAQVYNPVTMLKSFIFGKSTDSNGTTVESVSSNASFEELADVEYFLRQFLRFFKVPFSRYKTPENTMEKNESITYEEYSFSRLIIRIQNRISEGLKNGFITHLKLRGLWDKKGYELQESDIKIQMTKPVLYDLYETQKLVDAKMTIYKSYADQDELSKIVAMKKALNMTEKEIDENFKMLIKEKQLVAVADYYADQISPDNPPIGIKSPVRLKNDVVAEQQINSGEMPSSQGGQANNGGNDNTQPSGGSSFGGGSFGGGNGPEPEAGPEPDIGSEPAFGGPPPES